MVSKARLDFPDPDSPVTTISLSRGISTEMFFKLWTRAPWTAMVERIVVRAGLDAIVRVPNVYECQFLHGHVAHFRQLNGSGNLRDQAAIRQILAGEGGAFDIEVPAEVGIDLRRGSCLAHVAQM